MTSTRAVEVLADGRPTGVAFPVRWAHACDADCRPIDGAEPRELRIVEHGDGTRGEIDAWPGGGLRAVGLSEHRDGPIVGWIPIRVEALPGDTISIGPLVPADRATLTG